MTSTTGITNHRLFAPANNGNIRIHTLLNMIFLSSDMQRLFPELNIAWR